MSGKCRVRPVINILHSFTPQANSARQFNCLLMDGANTVYHAKVSYVCDADGISCLPQWPM